ncbi:hypothetical protein DY000_02052940 [Brassica cretica]|uniref:Uncharacterized protein n=1 Tax=Brassica cretica TaxID=69181 RepID=A0ABQ7AFA6_BRACR|nr:hypothetical protein DY000_02052940 [Brassica cretica]
MSLLPTYILGAHNNFERRLWLRQEYLTPQPCTAMAPDKGTFLMICEQPVKSHIKGAEIVTFSEPWGKAARATRHHIRLQVRLQHSLRGLLKNTKVGPRLQQPTQHRNPNSFTIYYSIEAAAADTTGQPIYPSLQPQYVPLSQQFGVVIARLQLLPTQGSSSWYGFIHELEHLPGARPSCRTQPSTRSIFVYGTRPLAPCLSDRYHYPLKAASPKGVTFSHIGLTLHPLLTSLSYIMSASSLTDMPVAPHPVGSSLLGTLAPSSSSSSSANDQPTKFHSSSSIKLKTTTSGGSETVAIKSLGLLL